MLKNRIILSYDLIIELGIVPESNEYSESPNNITQNRFFSLTLLLADVHVSMKGHEFSSVY